MRVLSIPAEHPYTQAIRPAGVAYLPDPDIDGHWWPHPAFEAGYWRGEEREPDPADVVHIHFGFEHRTPAQIEDLVRALPVPLVLTVHDVDNPHLEDQREHHERLRILVGAAAAVLTLTDCAADRLREEFGAQSVRVVPHPAIVARPPEPETAPAREDVAGVFLKSLRPNVVADPEFYITVSRRVRLRVFVHDVDATRGLRDALRGKIELIEHAPFDDATLHREIMRLSTCILPYTRGTHSGWLEMCRDLGTTVAVPDIGCYAGQVDTPEAVEIYRAGDAVSAAEAACALITRGPVPYSGDRAAQLERVRRAYDETYRKVVGQ